MHMNWNLLDRFRGVCHFFLVRKNSESNLVCQALLWLQMESEISNYPISENWTHSRNADNFFLLFQRFFFFSIKKFSTAFPPLNTTQRIRLPTKSDSLFLSRALSGRRESRQMRFHLPSCFCAAKTNNKNKTFPPFLKGPEAHVWVDAIHNGVRRNKWA